MYIRICPILLLNNDELEVLFMSLFSKKKKNTVVLTEENLKKAFGLNIRLIRSNNGRFWTVIE